MNKNSQSTLFRVSWRATNNCHLMAYSFFNSEPKLENYFSDFFSARLFDGESPDGCPPHTIRPHHASEGIVLVDKVCLSTASLIVQNVKGANPALLVLRYTDDAVLSLPSSFNPEWLEASGAQIVDQIPYAYVSPFINELTGDNSRANVNDVPNRARLNPASSPQALMGTPAP